MYRNSTHKSWRLKLKTNKSLFAAVLIAGLASVADATPLRMDYTVTDLGTGSYQYDFQVSLDNHDNTWATGQGWDWVFYGGGILDQSVPLANFVPMQGSLSNPDWVFEATTASTPAGVVTPIPTVSGSTLIPSTWIPTAIG